MHEACKEALLHFVAEKSMSYLYEEVNFIARWRLNRFKLVLNFSVGWPKLPDLFTFVFNRDGKKFVLSEKI